MKKLFLIVIVSLIGYVLIFFQTYIIHFGIRNNISSTYIDISYPEEIASTSLLSIVLLFITGLFLIFNNGKLRKYKIIILYLIHITSSFIISKEIFNARVSSWSTYTTAEEYSSVFLNSFMHILIGSTIYYLLLKMLLKSKTAEN